MRKHLILFLFLPIFSFGQVGLHDWDDTFYEKHKPSTFKNLEIAHQLIDTNNIDYELFNAAVFYCTNIQRTKHEKKPFKHSRLLEKAAQDHSKNMVTYNFFSHTSTVRGKTSMTDRLTAVGLSEYGAWAENIAISNDTNPTYWSFALKLVDQWMNSEGHKKNILNSNYNYLGCGAYYYKFEYGTYHYLKSTQTFSSTNK